MTARSMVLATEMGPTGSQRLGALGEELAYYFLLSRGYKVLLKNYECPLGEIDLIAKESGSLVFVEIKTRRSLEKGSPADAVTSHKQSQMMKTAKYYLNRYGIAQMPCRFDVVSVLLPADAEPVIELIRDAFGERR